jgi:predicted O-linked N-acetylglucosamine transferase (SPINDLY family)
VRYFCCQSVQKYLPAYDEIFPRIAVAVPNARFVFLNTRPRATEIFRRRLGAAFSRYGLWVMDYCRWVPELGQAAFSALIRDSDIFLDTIAWSGCNTALDALRHHVPIVTLPGELMRARHALAILQIAGVMDTVVHTVDEYVTMAARLGLDSGLRADISARLAAGAARVFGDQAPVRALEAFLTDVFERA